ncbi:hypothetical protein V1I91_18240 [Maribacter cobaltidurans]|uniref:Uncharacterized protein n=1 Tax=Maribacter cobaltidurans TaxID=1178778 RepID=A0ABU7IYL9_9FLAO|nr:hypothetical protein [Maribacter cobaltidurans]MEE1978023.1 hypothetical protein [Maribacter cobaltidurans]
MNSGIDYFVQAVNKNIISTLFQDKTHVLRVEKEIPKIRAEVFFRSKQVQFINYADGMDEKEQFLLQKIHREIPERSKQFSVSDLEDNFERVHEEVKSIFE